ncbi:MAG: (Fe-S)-binding protein, partial [Clostridium sp.]
AADGIENVIRVLEDMEDQKFSNLKFVELNACNGGCVGGVLTVENPYVAEVKLKWLHKYMPVSKSHLSEDDREFVNWTEAVKFEPVFNLGNTLTESFSRFNQVERICKKLPGLDCGSCGAPTCKALAEDIVRGEAGERDCIYHLRENVHKLSDEVTMMADCMIDGENFSDESLHALRECIRRVSDEMSRLEQNTGGNVDDSTKSD